MPKKILYIEDDEDTSNLVKRLIELRGYRVITASNGAEGLNRIKEDIDIVLLDVLLPDMCGWSILQKIREDPANKTLKVAFLSVVPLSDEQSKKFRDQGVIDYITKPFENIDFIKRIDRLIGFNPL